MAYKNKQDKIDYGKRYAEEVRTGKRLVKKFPLICPVCNKEYFVTKGRVNKSKFCSFPCYHKDLSINHRNTAFKKGHGQIGTDEAEVIRRNKISLAFTKEKHPLWIENALELTYIGLHNRVRIKYGKPEKCEFCNKPGEIRKSNNSWNIDWANKSGKYLTDDISDWLGLCRSCHVKYDNKLKKDNKKGDNDSEGDIYGMVQPRWQNASSDTKVY